MENYFVLLYSSEIKSVVLNLKTLKTLPAMSMYYHMV